MRNNYWLQAAQFAIPFFLGLVSAIWLSRRERNIQRRNLRSILAHELRHNLSSFEFYETMCGGTPDDAGLEMLATKIRSEVFEGYLNKLCELRPKQMANVYEAYTALRTWRDGILNPASNIQGDPHGSAELGQTLRQLNFSVHRNHILKALGALEKWKPKARIKNINDSNRAV